MNVKFILSNLNMSVLLLKASEILSSFPNQTAECILVQYKQLLYGVVIFCSYLKT